MLTSLDLNAGFGLWILWPTSEKRASSNLLLSGSAHVSCSGENLLQLLVSYRTNGRKAGDTDVGRLLSQPPWGLPLPAGCCVSHRSIQGLKLSELSFPHQTPVRDPRGSLLNLVCPFDRLSLGPSSLLGCHILTLHSRHDSYIHISSPDNVPEFQAIVSICFFLHIFTSMAQLGSLACHLYTNLFPNQYFLCLLPGYEPGARTRGLTDQK